MENNGNLSLNFDLDDFVREMSTMVERSDKAAERMAEAERLLGRLLVSSISWLPPEKRQPVSDGYARHWLYSDPNDQFEIMALVWQPGQRTPLHDHDGTWGAEGVIAGRIKVTNYQLLGEISENIVKLHKTDTIIVNERSTGHLLPPADCHILETEGDQTAITIHVYGKKLRKWRVFDPLEKEGVFAVRIHQASYVTE